MNYRYGHDVFPFESIYDADEGRRHRRQRPSRRGLDEVLPVQGWIFIGLLVVLVCIAITWFILRITRSFPSPRRRAVDFAPQSFLWHRPRVTDGDPWREAREVFGGSCPPQQNMLATTAKKEKQRTCPKDNGNGGAADTYTLASPNSLPNPCTAPCSTTSLDRFVALSRSFPNDVRVFARHRLSSSCRCNLPDATVISKVMGGIESKLLNEWLAKVQSSAERNGGSLIRDNWSTIARTIVSGAKATQGTPSLELSPPASPEQSVFVGGGCKQFKVTLNAELNNIQFEVPLAGVLDLLFCLSVKGIQFTACCTLSDEGKKLTLDKVCLDLSNAEFTKARVFNISSNGTLDPQACTIAALHGMISMYLGTTVAQMFANIGHSTQNQLKAIDYSFKLTGDAQKFAQLVMNTAFC